jgi:hypothetical protein
MLFENYYHSLKMIEGFVAAEPVNQSFLLPDTGLVGGGITSQPFAFFLEPV